jgi:hypothetical protein
MSRLPLALAVEPRLLPYAVANGFYMDSKARSLLFLIILRDNLFGSTATLFSGKCLKNLFLSLRQTQKRLHKMLENFASLNHRKSMRFASLLGSLYSVCLLREPSPLKFVWKRRVMNLVIVPLSSWTDQATSVLS